MTLVLTDSGLGGLSVLAHMLRKVELKEGSRKPASGKKIIYVNAAPKDGQGYNDMENRGERIRVFNCVLRNIHRLYDPHRIFVACGSLSGFLEELPFVRKSKIPVQGIDAVGKSLMRSALREHPQSPMYVFASPSTIAEGTFPRSFHTDDSTSSRIVPQACPGLATLISSDRKGEKVKEAIRNFAQQALQKWQQQKMSALNGCPLIFLGCTHYSFRAEFFVEMLREAGAQTPILLDPNPAAAAELVESTSWERGHPARKVESTFQNRGDWNSVSVEFFTPYELPREEIRTLMYFLQTLSPAASRAFAAGKVLPELIL